MDQLTALPRLEAAEFGPDLDMPNPAPCPIRRNRLNSLRPRLDGPAVEYPLVVDQEYAQRLILDCPFEPTRISLGLSITPGSEGIITAAIRKDYLGRPGLVVAATYAHRLSPPAVLKPAWVVLAFPFPEKLLPPGVYWVTLGFTGRGQAAWLLCPGNPWGRPGDAWSGHESLTEPVLSINGDFYFKIKGYPRPPGLPSPRLRPWSFSKLSP
ncbi:MAG: hypothetical protein HQK55_14255 [Deltaproteobacteria bacterium]|nr:hypothetical protein [Deltaproteobacteria bacterium]